MARYQIETELDLGDLGQVLAIVDGTIVQVGLFGESGGTGYYEIQIQKVIVRIPHTVAGAYVDVDVTGRVCTAAEVSFHEELEELFESDHRVGA